MLELCLRYLDLELDQDEIAEEVKRERGTPMYEIVSFLRGHDIVGRRIEATPKRLRAAIDRPVPGVLVAHTIAGRSGHEESRAIRLAELGYARVPNLHPQIQRAGRRQEQCRT